MVDSHVCVLQERFDPLSGMMRWSLSRKEICSCHGVVAPKVSSGRRCSRYDDGNNADDAAATANDANTFEDLWFTDDPLSLTNRQNWTPIKLDVLLGRSQCCKSLIIKLSTTENVICVGITK